ncbi:polysaccharide deacetylase family protein [Neobacillus sp. MER 74]|uniref:polysaccharide deacetylase family protein n=1 Tax=Neobacillus sp. MER 74 TaxID=2939566 RepID=UPI0020409360|nr:polysaccharide deacetylase family protein [Neobacillus sp. MER 74]MCM3115283.1 polysaccharide deacetylase family protein [Neobacillus sp. MER 74]
MIKILIMSFMLLFILFLIYAIVPTIFIRMSGRRIVKRVHAPAIAITFDDGPNPEYTPQLLDLLKKYGVKASFFVVGSKVKAYPDIIKRMCQEGHTIGIHHYNHISSWILTPFHFKRQLQMTEQAIYRFTNKKVIFYRPPWGSFNLFSLFLSKRFKVIMWSHIFGDWKAAKGKNGLLNQLLQATEAGSVLLLHDCGETWGADKLAPYYMLKCLEIYLQENVKKGTKFIALEEVSF